MVAYGGTFNNITSHADSTSHKSQVAAEKKAAGAHPHVLAMMKSPSMAFTGEKAKLDARATLALSALRYAPKSNIAELYGGDMLSLATKLAQSGPVLTAGGTTDRSITHGYGLLRAEIMEQLKGKVVSLHVDEANSQLAKRKKPMVLVVCSSLLPKPVFLTLFWSLAEDALDDIEPVAGGGGAGGGGAAALLPSDVAAALIKDELRTIGIDLESQVTCLVGDNANFVSAVAGKVDVPRGRCMPHSLVLVFSALTKRFPLFTTATLSLSSVLRAGGGTRREAALREAGIAPTQLRCVETRWNQLMDVALKLIDRGPMPQPPAYQTLFERVRKVMCDSDCFLPSKPKGAAGAAAAAAAAAAEVDDDDDADGVVRQGGQKVMVKTLLLRVREAYEVNVAQPQRTYHAEVECWIVQKLAPDLGKFIRLGSSDPANFPVEIFGELAAWREHLSDAASAGMQSIIMDAVYESSSYFFTPPERAALLERYKGPIKAAAEEALRVYDRYIPEMRAFLRHRLRFEPSRQPDEYPLPQGDIQISATDVANFFGVAEGKVSLALVIDWRTYCAKWPSIPASLKGMPSGKFWASDEVKGWFKGRQLCALGSWYAETPITNVPSERVFAIMRASEGHLRHALTEDSMTEELSAKCNDWLVDAMVQRQARYFRGGGGEGGGGEGGGGGGGGGGVGEGGR